MWYGAEEDDDVSESHEDEVEIEDVEETLDETELEIPPPVTENDDVELVDLD